MKPNMKKDNHWFSSVQSVKNSSAYVWDVPNINAATRREEIIDEKEGTKDYGNVVVIENTFAYKQLYLCMRATT